VSSNHPSLTLPEGEGKTQKNPPSPWERGRGEVGGFVLAELLVALAILAFIMIGVGALTSNIFKLQAYNSEAMTETDELRRFMKTFVAELRSAETSDNGGYSISAAASTSITFYDDLYNDGKREQIRYYVSGTTLNKGVTASTGVPPVYTSANETISEVIHNLTSANTTIFSYYPATYAGTTTPLTVPIDIAQIHLVKAQVIVDTDPNRAPGPVTDSTQVSIRNLKDNL